MAVILPPHNQGCQPEIFLGFVSRGGQWLGAYSMNVLLIGAILDIYVRALYGNFSRSRAG
jgi:hypothetical protein